MLNPIFLSLISLAPFTAFFGSERGDVEWIQNFVKTTPDFPIPGIQFKSYGPLMKDPAAFKRVIKQFADRYQGGSIDAIVALDARGFLFGSALAYEMNLPLIIVRKAGKLPGDVMTKTYELEYGKSSFEIEKNSLASGQKVLIVDDVVATGGTVCAAGELVESLGASVVEVACLIELLALNGRSRIPYGIFSLMQVP